MHTNTHRTRSHRRPARVVLQPSQHAQVVADAQRQLDEIDALLAEAGERSDRFRRLLNRKRGLLRALVQVEADHEEASEPVAWRPADRGRPGIEVVTRGGWEVYLPGHTAADAEALGLELLAF